MPSESEYPFNVVYWEFFNLNETTIQQKTGIIGNVRTVTIDDFFQGVTKQEDWYEEEERNIVKRFESLVLVLKNNLGEAKVYEDRKSTRLNSSHIQKSRMPSSA